MGWSNPISLIIPSTASSGAKGPAISRAGFPGMTRSRIKDTTEAPMMVIIELIVLLPITRNKLSLQRSGSYMAWVEDITHAIAQTVGGDDGDQKP